MSEENEVFQSVSSGPSAPSVSEATQSNQPEASGFAGSDISNTVAVDSSGDGKPEGWDQAEFNPEQLKRFNRVYKEMKDYQRETSDLRAVAKQQFEIIEELRQGQSKIVNYLQEDDYQKAENTLKSQRKEAYDRGDLNTVDEINDRLADIKIQKKLSAQQQVQQVKQPQPIQYRGVDGDDIVNRAVQAGAITPSDADIYKSWQSETDVNGNPLRPWINESDPRNIAAATEGRAVFNNPAFKNKSFAEKLREIDRRMGTSNNNFSSQGVLQSSNLTRTQKSPTVKLTQNQEHIALRTQFAGRGKTPQEHIEAYRKQVAELKGIRK